MKILKLLALALIPALVYPQAAVTRGGVGGKTVQQSDLIFPGVTTFSGSFIRPPATITLVGNAGALVVTNAYSFVVVTANSTITPSAVGVSGQTLSVRVTNGGAGVFTLTIDNGGTDYVTNIPVGYRWITYISNGTDWIPTTGDPAAGTASAAGLLYQSNPTTRVDETVTVGAAVSAALTAVPATVAQGGTGVATLTAYAPVFGGTTGTGSVQSGTAGTSGQVLTSNGAGVLPTFQAASGGALTSTQIGFGNGSNVLSGEAAFIYDTATNTMIVEHAALGGSLSSGAWTTGGIEISSASSTYTDTTSSGTVAATAARAFFGTPTLVASSVTTYTDSYSTLFGPVPTASTNVTQTRPHSVGVYSTQTAGSSSLSGAFVVGTGTAGTSVGIGNGIIVAGASILSTGGAITCNSNTTGATSGIGYSTGAGGTVTQATDRTTAVTLNRTSGSIVTNNTSLAALASASFTVNNSTVLVNDVVVVSIRSGQTNIKTTVRVTAVTTGTFQITVDNNDAVTAETTAITINFAIIRAVVS